VHWGGRPAGARGAASVVTDERYAVPRSVRCVRCNKRAQIALRRCGQVTESLLAGKSSVIAARFTGAVHLFGVCSIPRLPLLTRRAAAGQRTWAGRVLNRLTVLATLDGYRVAARDILVSISRSQSSACGQELRIEARPASATTKGPSPVFVYCG
jgi:hypothetical protein